MSGFVLRGARPGDEPGAYHVCLRTGDHGADGEPFYRDDPDALGRIYAGPYLAFAPELALILEDEAGMAGYALGVADTRAFHASYEREWRPRLCARFPAPTGPREHWSRVQEVHDLYHHPDYFTPEPYADFPAHLHIDLLPRAQGAGWGRRMIAALCGRLRERGVPGVHLGMSARNWRADGFYRRLGFHELGRVGDDRDGCVYLGLDLRAGGPAAERGGSGGPRA